jgi:hypothetical protein
MFPCGAVVANIIDAVRGRSDKPMQDKIWRMLNSEYFLLAREHSWEDMRKEPISVDMNDDTGEGVWLPSDLIGIDLVFDDDNKIEFIEKNRADANLDEDMFKYFTFRGSEDELFSGTDAVVATGGTSFTSDALVADGESVDGEYVAFGDCQSYHKISGNSSPFEFTPSYTGPSLSGGDFFIRPRNTKKIRIMDPDENYLTDRTVQVYYWAYPRPLLKTTDLIMLPTTEILELRVISKLPEAKPNRPISQAQVDRSLVEAIRMNGDFPEWIRAKGKGGKAISWTDSFYGDR